MAGAIESLGNGLVPAGPASTAAVKPDEIKGRSVIEGYEESSGMLTDCVSCIDNLPNLGAVCLPVVWTS